MLLISAVTRRRAAEEPVLGRLFVYGWLISCHVKLARQRRKIDDTPIMSTGSDELLQVGLNENVK